MLPSPLYVVCDHEVCTRAGWSVVDFADACLQGGAQLLQVRAKDASGRDFLTITERVVKLAAQAGALVVVNDRADIARITGAGGVHVGQDDLSAVDVRRIVNANTVVGLSTHTHEQIDGALAQPIDYLAIGPVFATGTKDTGYDAVGVERVQHAAACAKASNLEVVAIGGITLDRVHSVLDAGATAVAIISDLLVTKNPTARVREYLSRMSV